MDKLDDNDPTTPEFSELEAELRRLRPTLPPARLVQAIDRQLAREAGATASAGEVRSRLWWFTVPLAAAAAWAVWVMADASGPIRSRPTQTSTAAMAGEEKPGTAAGDLFQPVAAKSVPLAERAEDLVTLDDGTIARRTRETYLATITWRNPRTNASLTWSVPREEVQVVPVSYQ